jgi:predicted phosphodiesterase
MNVSSTCPRGRRNAHGLLAHRRTALLPLSLVLVSAGVFAAEPSSEPLALKLGPSLTCPTRDSVRVWWHLSAEAANHRVEFGMEGRLDRSVVLNERTRSPYVKLDGLMPGTAYSYRVRSGDVASDVYTFRLPGGDSRRRLAIWSDNQNGVEVFTKQTVPAVLRAKPEAVLDVGDVVQHGDEYDEWAAQLYGPARELLRTVPWFPVRGNHDGESDLAKEMLRLPEGNGWYAVTFGPLRLVVLDSNVDYGPGSPQYAWLTEELAGPAWKNARFRLVAFHHPPFTSLWDDPGYDGEALGRSTLVPLLEGSGADLVVCGHAHAYERGKRKRPDGRYTHYLIVGGGGGALDTVRVFPWPHVERAISKHHIVVADITNDAVKLDVIDTETGKPMDTLTISAGAGR